MNAMRSQSLQVAMEKKASETSINQLLRQSICLYLVDVTICTQGWQREVGDTTRLGNRLPGYWYIIINSTTKKKVTVIFLFLVCFVLGFVFFCFWEGGPSQLVINIFDLNMLETD